MPAVNSSVIIKANCEDLFALSQNYSLRSSWDPFILKCHILQPQEPLQRGSRVWVRAKNGFSMEVEYTAIKSPFVVAMKMVHGPFFFRHFLGLWKFTPLSPQQTQVQFRYSFHTRWPFARPILDPLIKMVFQRDIRQRLQGLKTAVERKNLLNYLETN